MSSNDPFESVTPRKPVRPARASLATASNAGGGPESRQTSVRAGGHAQRASLSNITLDFEKTPRKPAAGASPLLSETSQSRIGSGERSTSGGSKGSSTSSRATVGVGSRARSGQPSTTTGGSAVSSTSTAASSSSTKADRSHARRSLVLNSSMARGGESPALRSAPLTDRKRSAPAGDDESFDADMSNDTYVRRDNDDTDADTSTRSTLADRERRRRSAMHAQEVHILRSESRLGSRQGHRDDDEIGDGTEDQSDESEPDQLRRRQSGTYEADTSVRSNRRSSLYHEDDDLEGSTMAADRLERHKFPQRPSHSRHDTAESSGTGGGTGTDTSGTEGAGEYSGSRRSHVRNASKSIRNGDGHTSGSSGITASTSGKRRRRKHSSASGSQYRHDSNASRPSTSFEDRQAPHSGRAVDEFDQPHWQAVGARSRRISLTQQQQSRSRIRSTESDVTAVREAPEPAETYSHRSVSGARRSPLIGAGVHGHERAATMSDLDYGLERRPATSYDDPYRSVPEHGTARRDVVRRHTPHLSVSRSGEGRDELPERTGTPQGAYRSSTVTIRDRASRTPDPNMSSGLVSSSARRTPSGMGSSTLGSRGYHDDLAATVRPGLDGIFNGGAGGAGAGMLPLCDRNMQRAYEQFETYFSFPSVSGPTDTASNPGSAIRPRASSIATDAPTATSGSGRSANGTATPSTPTSGGGHSAGALADSVELVACFKAVTLMASELNSGLRRLREDVNEAHVDADVHNDPHASTLWRMGKDLGQLVKASDTQLRNLTEGLLAFKRADRERERARKFANATNSENGSVAGGGGPGSSNRSNSRLSNLLLAQRSPGSEARRTGREAAAIRASISEYRRGGAASSTSNLGLNDSERDHDRLIASPTSLQSGRSSNASTSTGTPQLDGNLFHVKSLNGGASSGSRHLSMSRQDSNNSGSTTTSVSPRPPDTPTPMPPGSNGKDAADTSMTTSLTSRLRSAIGDRLSTSSTGRHGRSASAALPSPAGGSRVYASLSRVTGAAVGGSTRDTGRFSESLSSASGSSARAVVEEERSPVTATGHSSSGSLGRRAGASAAAAALANSLGSSASSPPSARQPPASLSPRRSRLALPALTKNS